MRAIGAHPRRRCAEHAAVLAAELAGAFVADTMGGGRGIGYLSEQQSPRLLQPQLLLVHPAWGDMHLGPENALEANALLGGGALMPVHWGTFALSTHEWDQPVETLLALAPKKGAQLLIPPAGRAR